jgi:glycosyltransferase involved in cell wall biosynthesis
MSKFYKEIDLFVSPSTQPDPFPTVILEAMDYGLPVVATAHGGPLEIIKESETGILIPWDNAKQASEKIERILKKDLLILMGKNGKKRVNEIFNRDIYEKKILDVIETL